MVALFALTLLISSSLLFLLQPMVAKAVLPSLGGSPAVWNTCMVFFQAALLAGYAYAHASVRWLGVKRQAVLHLALVAATALLLPPALRPTSPPEANVQPVTWLLGFLAVSVGVPFFVVSSSAPLFQRWFSTTGHPRAHDPYFLYAASNLGSLAALLGYPLLVEPALPLDRQGRVWSIGYVILGIGVLLCAAVVWLSRSASRAPAHPASSHEPFAPVDARRILRWIALACVPSSLMLGVTTHLTTNLAAVPLLWVVPLAIYLLTFVLVFARKPLMPHEWTVRVLPFVVLPLGLLFFSVPRGLEWLAIPLHLLMFFLATMVCHGELVRCRPSPEKLTAFYFWMSVGGVLGGLFNAVVAPLVFTQVLEYPLAMAAACMLLPYALKRARQPDDKWFDLLVPIVVAVLAVCLVAATNASPLSGTTRALGVVFGPIVLLTFSFKERPVRFGLSYAVVLATMAYYTRVQSGSVLHVERNFFGVKRVLLDRTGQFRSLAHGSTNHGCQSADPEKAGLPLAYYHPSGPVGDLFTAYSDPPRLRRVGVLGLGIGSLAAYRQPERTFTFYEIDPAVERIARNSDYFTFLTHCGASCEVELGDGRLKLAEAPDGTYDLLVLDVFSSDAIPAHLLSLEALELYLTKLSPQGLLVCHISNRYLLLEPLVANLAARLQWACVARADIHLDEAERALGKYTSHYVVMARDAESLAPLMARPQWRRLQGNPNGNVWTDQYSDLLSLIRRRAAPAAENH